MAKKRVINTLVHQLVQNWEYVSWDDFNPTPMPTTIVNKHGNQLCDDFISLDTETSWNHDKDKPIAWVYQWAFTYKGQVVYGRKPSQLVKALSLVASVNHLGGVGVSQSGIITRKIVVYVHNLSYDYAYIEDWLRITFGGYYITGESKEKMLAIAPHSIITHDFDGFDFKCSFKLTHKSLDKWSKDLNTPHKKLVGTVDYDEVHYQDSELKKSDWDYMFGDVIVLDECIRTQLKMYNDDIISVPLTVTGYVRRDVRCEYLKEKRNRYGFIDRKLSASMYGMCRHEFAGGLTHGNRMYSGKTIRVGESIYTTTGYMLNVESIKHRDFRSHYPSQQRCYEFPIGRPVLYYDKDKTPEVAPPSVKELIELSESRCFLAEIMLVGAELKNFNISIPYLQFSKCAENGHIEDVTTDNGRVLQIKGKIFLTVNEDDLKLLALMYRMKCVVTKVVTMKRGKLPAYLLKSIDKFFKNKTDYKDQVKALEAMGVKSCDPRMIEACINLMIAKGMLNGIYGMTATELIREAHLEAYFDIEEDGVVLHHKGEWYIEKAKTEDEKQEVLDDYYGSFTSFMDYQFGCWTTSHARLELIKFCVLIGWERVLYCDTDSIFYISSDEIEKRVERENQKMLNHSEEIGAFIVSDKGKKVHYDQFELEKEEIVAFRFLHAKCYAYEKVKYEDSVKTGIELCAVIAGVKRIGENENGEKVTREQELGSIDDLSVGKVFESCGGICKTYVTRDPEIMMIDGHETEVASACVLTRTTKTIKDMDDIIIELSEKRELYQFIDEY